MAGLRSPRRIAILALTLALTIVGFGWPFFVSRHAQLAGDAFAPFVVGALLAVVVAVVVAELGEGGMDARSVAMLGLLAGLGIGLRALGPATAGIEPTFVLVILAARVFGPGFGFTYGSVVIAASAVLTAGVGPWLPFQMLATAWLGLAFGLVPRRPVRTETARRRRDRAEPRWLALASLPAATAVRRDAQPVVLAAEHRTRAGGLLPARGRRRREPRSVCRLLRDHVTRLGPRARAVHRADPAVGRPAHPDHAAAGCATRPLPRGRRCEPDWIRRRTCRLSRRRRWSRTAA